MQFNLKRISASDYHMTWKIKKNNKKQTTKMKKN